MHSYDYLLLLAFFAIVLLPAPWLGRFCFKVMEGQRTWLTPVLGPLEHGCYRLAGVRAEQEQNWKQYTLALLAFNRSASYCCSPCSCSRVSAAEPAAAAGAGMDAGVQHCSQFHDQHQLAGLQR